MLSWIFIVLAHGNNSPRIDMSPHSDTLYWFQTNQSPSPKCCVLSIGGTNTNFIVFGLTRSGIISPIYRILAGVSKWAGTRYFYPSEIVYSTGRNYWTPPKLAVVKTTSTIGLWNIFHKKLMITSIAEFSHSNRKTAFSHDQVDGIFPVLKITLP